MGADIVRAVGLRRKVRPPGWPRRASGGRPVDHLRRKTLRDTETSRGRPKRGLQLGQAPQHGQGVFRIRADEKAHAGVQDQPLAGDAGAGQRRHALHRRNASDAVENLRRRHIGRALATPRCCTMCITISLALDCCQLRIERGIGKAVNVVEIIHPLRQRPALHLGRETVDRERSALVFQARASPRPAGRFRRPAPPAVASGWEDAAPMSRMSAPFCQQRAAMRQRRLGARNLPPSEKTVVGDVEDAENFHGLTCEP